MKILVTGFEPFGGAVINPAYEAVKLLPDVIAGAEVIKIEIPTVFGKDARVNLYGEWKFGAGKNRNNVLMITLGTGLGGAAVIDGRVIYGATGSAGEIGHINMFREGRECRCGSSGCLGRYVSALGILCTFREKVQLGQHSIICDWVNNDLDKVTADMLSRAYDDGDADRKSVV